MTPSCLHEMKNQLKKSIGYVPIVIIDILMSMPGLPGPIFIINYLLLFCFLRMFKLSADD